MSVKLVLSRKSEWMNRLRPYKVLIDGQQIGTIGNGKVEEFEIPAISHSIECKVDWCFSNRYELQANDGEMVYLQVKSGMKAFWLLYVVLIIFLVSSFLMPQVWKDLGEKGEWIRRAIVLIPIVYMGYYLTIGRRQYLKLEKDTSNVFAV